MFVGDNVFTYDDWLEVYDGVLYKTECLELISFFSKKLTPSSVLGEKIQGYRTSSDYFLNEEDKCPQSIKNIINKLEKITSTLTHLPVSHQEDISIIRYTNGQQYKEHYDYLYFLKDQTEKSGDRLFTCMFYLNDDFTGGETCFVKEEFAVQPQTGRAIFWKNYVHGLPNQQSLHAALPIKSGEKWVITKWIREKPFKAT